MANTPRIRFKGFTDDWEQRKLGEIIDAYNEKKPKNIDLPVLTSSRQGIQKQEEHFGSEQKHDTKDYNVIPMGYCTYRNRSDDKTFTFNINHSVKRGIVSKFYPVFSIINGNAKFITEFLNNNLEIKNKLAVLAVGTSQVVLSFANLKELEICVPSKLEQDKIGNYIETLDHLITLHQRKCDETKKLKKFMLQKMFPKNGEKNPEIRFAGFTDDWEQRKFGDVVQRQSDIIVSDENYLCVEYEDVISNQGELNKDLHTKHVSKSGVKFSSEDVLYGKLRPYLHNWLNPDFDGVAVGDWWVLKPISLNKNFLYTLIQTPIYDAIANQSSGTKMPRADWKLVSNTYFDMPLTLLEQEKIAYYFSTLDHLITLHQRKCDNLKLIKKFMLQNMFPKKG